MTATPASLGLWGIVRVYWSLLLGNVVEWYEFAIFGFLEPYLEDKFFQGSAIGAWLGFGVTFLARPLGGVVFGTICDKFGRSVSVNLSLIGMLIGTAGQGCLPTYASGNAAGAVGLAILILFRLLQGLSAAGEISTIATYITEVGDPKTIGRSISLIAITINLGFLAAKAVVFFMTSVFGEEFVEDWGWRIPFIISLIPGLIAVWGRRHVPESHAFLEEKEKQAAQASGTPAASPLSNTLENGAPSKPTNSTRSVRKTLADNAGNILIGMCGIAAAAIMQYGCFVWINTYLKKHGMSSYGLMLTSLSSRVVMIGLNFSVGWLTDRKGVAWVLFMGGALLAVCSVPLWLAVVADPKNVPLVVGVVGFGFGSLGALSLTTMFYFVVELFPTAVRGCAVGLSFNLGFGLFGGLAPFGMQAAVDLAPIGPGILLALGGLLTMTTIWAALVMRRNGRVITYVRNKPYFASGKLCSMIGDDQVKVGKAVGTDGISPNVSENAVENDGQRV